MVLLLRSGRFSPAWRDYGRFEPEFARIGTNWPGLEPVMRERFIRIGHAVGVFPLLNRAARIVVGIEDLARKLLDHRFSRTLARGGDEPAKRQGALSVVPDV